MSNINLFLSSGYLNMAAIIDTGYPFIFIVGARGIGKTYGALEYVLKNKIPHIYMRRTQVQADMVMTDEMNPIAPLNEDNNWDYRYKKINKNMSGLYEFKYDDEKQKAVPTGSSLGMLAALSTISNIRGFDAQSIQILIYDEFIPEPHEKLFRNEGLAFKNAYETINRNRELKGNPPLKAVAMANSNDIGNPMFLEFRVITDFVQMRKKKQQIKVIEKRGILLIDLKYSPISAAKQGTALYTASGDDDFSKMALANEFSNAELESGVSRPLKEYRPVVKFGEITFYIHKSRNVMYASTHRIGSPIEIGLSSTEVQRFKRSYGWITEMYLSRQIEFEEYFLEILFTKYLR